ncbi:MAG: hypothetical protein AAGE59_12635, partial [Cyanobacteria bacterium P01_F01_bin.86]
TIQMPVPNSNKINPPKSQMTIVAQMLLDRVRPQVEPPSSRLFPGVHNTSEAKHSAYRCWGA